jgi:uncharacterized protein YydD (DUF2326 family)
MVTQSHELENVKESFVGHMHSVQAAAVEISQQERVKNMYGTPNMFNTSAYANLLSQWDTFKNEIAEV